MEEKKLLKRKERADESGNLEQLAHYCRELGDYYRKLGKYNEALRQYKEEENINVALSRPIAAAVSNRMIGEIYCDIGNFKEALKYQEKHLLIARKEGDEVEEQRALANLGRTYFCMAEAITKSERKEYDSYLSSAKKVYIQSLELSDTIQGIGYLVQMEMRARLLLNIGLVLECQGNLSEAANYISKATSIAIEANLPEELFRCHSAFGVFHHRRGDSDKALRALNLALAAAERLDTHEKLACEVLLSKAEVLFSIADFEGAKHALMKAFKLRTPDGEERKSVEKNLKIAVKLCRTEREVLSTDGRDHQALKSLYETLGDGVVAIGNFKKAIEYYLKMLECAKAAGDCGRALCPIYVSLAQTYKDDCQYDLALKYARQELEISKDTPQEACKTMLTICELLEQKKAPYIEVAGSYLRAKEYAMQAQDWKLLASCLHCLRLFQKNSSLEDLAEETEKERRDVMKQHNVSDSSGEEDGDGSEEEFGGSVDLDQLAESDSDEENHGNDLRGDQTDRRSKRRKATCKSLAVQRNEKGETALHRACINGNTSLVERLIERGHPINVRDHCGWTPLHEACNHGFEEIVSRLLASGAHVNDRGGTHCGGVTPIHDAASCGHLSIVRMLLSAGALLTVRTDKGETPLVCLRQWHERVKGEIDSRTEEEFRDLERELSSSLEKIVGQEPEARGHTSRSDGLSRKHSRHLSQEDSGSEPLIAVHKGRGDKVSTPRCRTRESPNLSSSAVGEEDDGCISEGSASSADDEPISSHSKSVSKHVRTKAKGLSASSDYARTIASLKNRQSLLSLSKDSKGPRSRSGEEKSPLLAEGETVVDDWLEDDVGVARPPLKRAKRCVGGGEGGSRGHHRASPPPPYEVQLEEEEGPQGGEPLPTVSPSGPEAGRQARGSPEAGRLLQAPVLPPQCPGGVQLVKVDVEGTLLLVPLDMSATFDCLAKEVARRYQEFKGVSVELMLHTREGAVLSRNDPVTFLSSLAGGDPQAMVLVANVTSLTLPPITESYSKACRSNHVEPDKEVSQSLEMCEAIHSLSLDDMGLGPKEFGTVAQVLGQHRNLAIRRLSLASNDIGDKGLKLLCRGLSVMQSLVTLDLSCNGITAIGLSDLASAFTQQSLHNPPLQVLAELNLSHNPLKDTGFPHLATVLSGLMSLTSLSVSDCSLSSCDSVHSSGSLLNLDSLERLDVSLNALGPEGVAAFLASLQPAKLKALNVSRTLGHSTCARKIAREVALLLTRDDMSPPSNLVELDLSQTLVNDMDLFEVIRGLEDNCLLERLGLDCNPHLTSLSLRRLLERGKWQGLCVSLSGCPKIFDYMEGDGVSLAANWMGTQAASSLPSQISLSVGASVSEGTVERFVGTWKRVVGAGNALVERGPFGHLRLGTTTSSPPLVPTS